MQRQHVRAIVLGLMVIAIASWSAATLAAATGKPPDLAGRPVQAFFVDGTTLWAGTEGGEGIYRSTNNGETWQAAGAGLTHPDVLAIVRRGSDLLAGTWGGGAFYGGPPWTAMGGMAPDYKYIRSIVVATDGTAYAADPRHKLYRLAAGSYTWSEISATGLPSQDEHIRFLFLDQSARLYAGLVNYGVYEYNGVFWTRKGDLGGRTAYAMDYGPGGLQLWVATSNGVFRWEGGAWALVPGSTGWEATALKRGPQGELFVGTMAGQVYRYRADGDWELQNLGIPAGQRVWCLAYGAGTPRRLFVGAADGLYYQDLATPTPTATPTLAPQIRLVLRSTPDECKPLKVNDQLTYIIRYENPSAGVANNVRVQAPFPQHVEYISSEPQGALTPGVGLGWQLGAVPGGASGELRVQVKVVNSPFGALRDAPQLVTPLPTCGGFVLPPFCADPTPTPTPTWTPILQLDTPTPTATRTPTASPSETTPLPTGTMPPQPSGTPVCIVHAGAEARWEGRETPVVSNKLYNCGLCLRLPVIMR